MGKLKFNHSSHYLNSCNIEDEKDGRLSWTPIESLRESYINTCSVFDNFSEKPQKTNPKTIYDEDKVED